MTSRTENIALGDFGFNGSDAMLPGILIAEIELLDRTRPVVELHNNGWPSPAAVGTGMILCRQDNGPHLRFVARPLLPPALLVGVIMGTLIGPLLLSRRHGVLLTSRAGEEARTPNK